VALRAWLADQGYTTDLEGGGDVSVLPQENGLTLSAFVAGDIDGAWVPEPWATRLVQQGGGHVLVDERDLWPDGRFVTTHLIVSTSFLEANPAAVKALLTGHVQAIEYLNANETESQAIVSAAIEELTKAELPAGTLAAAWESLTFTADPIADSLTTSARQAEEQGLLKPVDLTGIHDLSLLNEVLVAAGDPAIETP
jgi:NitT/TauT family transport system substrate-binding protein